MRQLKMTRGRTPKFSLEELLKYQNRNSAVIQKLRDAEFEKNPGHMDDLKAFINDFSEILFKQILNQQETEKVADNLLKFASITNEKLYNKFFTWVLRHKIEEILKNKN